MFRGVERVEAGAVARGSAQTGGRRPARISTRTRLQGAPAVSEPRLAKTRSLRHRDVLTASRGHVAPILHNLLTCR